MRDFTDISNLTDIRDFTDIHDFTDIRDYTDIPDFTALDTQAAAAYSTGPRYLIDTRDLSLGVLGSRCQTG